MKHAFYLILFILIIVGGLYVLQMRPGEVQYSAKQVKPSPDVTNPFKEGAKSVEEEIKEIVADIGLLAKDFDPFLPFSIKRVWFESGSFYIEYENSKGMLAQLLIIKEGGAFKGEGYFTPSESGWVLQAGGGGLVGASAVLYEKDEQGEWVRKN